MPSRFFFKRRTLCTAIAAIAAALPAVAAAQDTPTLDRVTVVGGRPATLPLEIPTTTESTNAAQM